MKKLALTAVILLSGIQVFAQYNFSELSQTGGYNRSVVTQNGKHASFVLQHSDATSSSQENLANINQSNISEFGIQQSISRVEHYGHLHMSTVIQKGENKLEAYIGSSGDHNVKNETYSWQYGLANEGVQRLEGTASKESILSLKQGGTHNYSEQIGDQSIRSEGSVLQVGKSNVALQRLEGTVNVGQIVQTSDENKAFQQIVGVGSSANVSVVVQSGNGNSARVVTQGDANFFNVQQLGNGNEIGGVVDLLFSNATQEGVGNYVLITQVGKDNAYGIRQSGDDNVISGESISGALQLGNFNTGIFSQQGFGLKIITDQYGNNNLQTVTQMGNDSESRVFQTGGSNMSQISQVN